MTKTGEALPVIPCGVALILKDGKFLIAQRCRDDSFGSFWEFPGGKQDAGETLEQCVVREAREELGVEIRVEKKFIELRRAYKKRMIWLHFYLCSHLGGEPRPIECQKVAWIPTAQLGEYRFPPANDRVIAKLIEEGF